MKTPDLDKARSEQQRTVANFCTEYNKELPEAFAPVSVKLLNEYRRSHPESFRDDGTWSLDQHRKKIMDWLPLHSRTSA